MRQIVVNLYGGPGSGKSTIAAKVFAELKETGVNAELNTEYAKHLTWRQSFQMMKNQLYIFAKQHELLYRLRDKVDVIVTDSPLLLSLVYGEKMSEAFKKLVKEEYDKYENFNVFLQRPSSYQMIGRTQTLEEAKEIDSMIRYTLYDHGYSFNIDIPVHENLSKIISQHVKSML